MRFSIIIPVYNRGLIVPICVRKILEANYQDFELILVDDGSSDNSFEECQKLSSEFQKVHVYHQPNKGVSAARNLGIEKAKGEYILFVDSDDIINPDSFQDIEQLVKYDADLIMFRHGFIKPKNCNLVIPQSPLVNEPETIIGNKEIVSWIFTTLNPKVVPYYTVWGKAIKRSILVDNNIRFREDVSLGEDQILICDLLCYVDSFVYTAAKYYYIISWPITMSAFGLGSYHRSMDNYLYCQVANYEGLMCLYARSGLSCVKEYAAAYILDRPITRILFRNVDVSIKNKDSYNALKKFCYEKITPVLQLESNNLVQLRNKNTSFVIRMLLGNVPFSLIYYYCCVWVNVLEKIIGVVKRIKNRLFN